ncbi:hypothetical protein [Euzebya tangerina]|uniref:hypothetical protein n=1 Tax=Euzebya tangerina TaxID=591198 RepID=UPI000E313CFC|nr:hypothetical protein [Euzebya tangerina]
MRPVSRSLPVVAIVLLSAVLLGACAAEDEAADVTVQPSDDASDAPVSADESDVPAPTEGDTAGSDGVSETAEESADGASGPRFPLTGTLELVEVEGGCLVLDVDGEQYEVLADPSSELAVDARNGVVADASGSEIASAGDEVTVEGAIDPGMATFCQVGTPLFVTAMTAS